MAALGVISILFSVGCRFSRNSSSDSFHLVEISGFGSNPGGLRMFEYVPSSPRPNAEGVSALVVAIHGCAQNAQDFADHSGWPELANWAGFLLVFPEQSLTNNPAKCFNWFTAKNSRRDSGEALSIKQMVDKMRAEHRADPKRVFVTGLSAGGAMASIMLATYPELFAGGAIMSGVPYGCATNIIKSFSCLRSRINKTPREWGDLVRHASPAVSWPIVSIWQGTRDKVLDPANAEEETEQWTDVHGVSDASSRSDTVEGHPHRTYFKNGRAVVEVYSIADMGHGQAVYPGSSDGRCGKSAMFFPDAHICAAFYASRFWGLVK